MILNGETIHVEDISMPFKDFARKLYKIYNIDYAKFFKMDNLCKLALLTSEFLLRNEKIHQNTAIVLSNRASSLDTDRKHQQSINSEETYYPSPSIFVYTLPNIAIGEISIKHKLQGEHVFFVSEKIDEKLLYHYSKLLVENKKANNVLCGWVEFDESHYEAFLMFISEKGTITLTPENIIKLFKIN